MPRGKAIKFPSPDDVARQIARSARVEEKRIVERIKQLVQKIAPTLTAWGEDETLKVIPNDVFESEAEQTGIAAKLAEAGWKVDDKGQGIVVHRPVPAAKKKPKKVVAKKAPAAV